MQFINIKKFGFIDYNLNLNKSEKNKLHNLINKPDENIRNQYELKLANTIGQGFVNTFASGRMAFYSLLLTQNIQTDDEIIITGFTCSVMINAIFRCNAKAVFSDIDIETFGSCPISIKKCITSKTKIIVAQHSFGIPCKIDKIKNIAKEHNIFLIEDCALTFMSSYKNIILGNWGDAAIFSTDHSKPLNTFIGGFCYTKNKSLNLKITEIKNNLEELDRIHQYNILNQIHLENIFTKPNTYWVLRFLNLYIRIYRKYFTKNKNLIHLSEDNTSIPSNNLYKYPLKMPIFLCYLGLLQIEEYINSIEKKRSILKQFLLLDSKNLIFPNEYFNKDSYIIPLRVVFISESKKIHNLFSTIIDSKWFWFKNPIVATNEPLSNFGYISGTCPNSEEIGKKIINFPTIHYDYKSLLKYFIKKLK